ncbi:gluconokinase [Agilicoccus flavus]|uniref:gluconokinase n=1 Tax=Agilicoccus flavus TaxID=2775968 RepID=UPI001CF68F23|nr:gluconokinase [Agilicoccus flavus]
MSEDDVVLPPAEVVIGLDVGTTAAKASAFGIDSSWRHTVVREYPLLHPKPGWEVQDPQVVLAAVMASLSEAAEAAGGAKVVAISLSSAMHGLIGLGPGGRPLTPLLTWADSRAGDIARELRADPRAAELHRVSGTPVHSFSPLAKLMWFRRNEPELCAKVTSWIGLKDWIIQALTGTLATELSCASGTGLLDLTTRDWNPTALELAGVEYEQLPPVLPTTSALGLSRSVAARIGLPTATGVVLGAGDGPLGNLGTGALTPGVVGLSLGTSGALRMAVDGPVVDHGGGLFCYALTEQTWVVGGAVSNGGVVVRWCGDVFARDLLKARAGQEDAHVDAELLSMARSVPVGCDGLVMLPYLLAERAPLWNPDLPGAYLGVRRSHTRGHFVRAAIEGVALQMSTILDDLDAVHPVESVRATGGVFRSALWRVVLASALARPLTVTGGAEGSALGAAALALYGLGRADSPLAGLALLPAGQDSEPTIASQADVRAYRELRSRVVALSESVAEAVTIFAG